MGYLEHCTSEQNRKHSCLKYCLLYRLLNIFICFSFLCNQCSLYGKFPLDSNNLLGIFLIFSFHSQTSLSKYLLPLLTYSILKTNILLRYKQIRLCNSSLSPTWETYFLSILRLGVVQSVNAIFLLLAFSVKPLKTCL